MGNVKSKKIETTYSYHIQKEISPGKFFLVWPTNEFSDYCFQVKVAERELQKLKLSQPIYNYRLLKCEVKLINRKANKTGRFKVIKSL